MGYQMPVFKQIVHHAGKGVWSEGNDPTDRRPKYTPYWSKVDRSWIQLWRLEVNSTFLLYKAPLPERFSLSFFCLKFPDLSIA